MTATINIDLIYLKGRPLSARERRRLKQSQEKMFPSGNFFFYANSSTDAVGWLLYGNTNLQSGL